MSLADKLVPTTKTSMIATILGDAGLGKTSLACTFPKSIIIRAEDGLQSVPEAARPAALPVVDTVADLWSQLKMIIDEDHDYQTLIIDSVTALERLFERHIVDTDKNKPLSINQALGGYGAGPKGVGILHQRVRKAAGILNAKKNMNVVFIGHATTEKVELPDQDPYTRYSMRLGKHSIAPYSDDSDLVGFMKLRTFVKGEKDETKKAISDGSRVLVCYATAANISKNRYGITQDLPVKIGTNPLAQYLGANNKEEV